MISEIHYGGRVTDEWDKRCLRNILADILNEESLVPRYKYTLAAIYGGPPEPDNIPVIMNSIQQLPINDDPEVFGLNENAEIVCAQKEANALFDTIGMQILAQNGIPDYHKDEEASKTVADILSHLPYLLPTPAPTEEHTGLYGILRMETQKYNTLLDSIRTSLQHFANAQLGLVALSAEMESLKNDLLANIVPTSWLQHSYPTMKSLAAYLRDLSSRVTFIRQWIDEGEPKVFWLAGLFSPQSLITGLLQKYSALHKVPIDMVALSCTVHDDSPLLEDNGDVCFISGIFMEGSRYCLIMHSAQQLTCGLGGIQLHRLWKKRSPKRCIQKCRSCALQSAPRLSKQQLTHKAFLLSLTSAHCTIPLPEQDRSHHWVYLQTTSHRSPFSATNQNTIG